MWRSIWDYIGTYYTHDIPIVYITVERVVAQPMMVRPSYNKCIHYYIIIQHKSYNIIIYYFIDVKGLQRVTSILKSNKTPVDDATVLLFWQTIIIIIIKYRTTIIWYSSGMTATTIIIIRFPSDSLAKDGPRRYQT